MKFPFLIIPTFFLSSCIKETLHPKDEAPISTLETIHELRSDISQLAHLIHGYSVDLQLLEEKVSNLALKKRELMSESVEIMQERVDRIESLMSHVKTHLEQSRKQTQQLADNQLQRLTHLENKVHQHESSLHIIKDLKGMLSQLKNPGQNYTVISGDTLEGIARKFAIKVSDLKSHNQIQSDQIQIGQILKIPL